MKIIPQDKPLIGWHFIKNNGRTSEGDLFVKVGQTLSVEGNIELCHNGLHWCKDIFDALEYAPGEMLCKVSAWGETVTDGEKSASRYRRCESMRDITRELHIWGCLCVTHALKCQRKMGREPDPASWNAVDAKLMWLDGFITDDELAWSVKAAWAASPACTANAAWSARAANVAWAARAANVAWAARAAWSAKAAWAAERRWQERTLRGLVGKGLEVEA